MRINKLMTKVLLAIVVLGIVLGNLSVVKAATGSVTFTQSAQKVKAGDTISVTISATCDEGFSGVNAYCIFNKAELELVSRESLSDEWSFSANLKDSEDTTKMKYDILSTEESTEPDTYTEETADLAKLTFKVKDGVTSNSSIEIKFDEIQLFDDRIQKVTVPTTQTVNFTVESNNLTPTPTVTPTPTPTATPSVTPTPTTTPTVTPSTTPTPSDSSTNTAGREVVVYTDDDNTTNSTSKNATSNEASSGTSILPYTGMSSFIVIGLVLVVVSAVGLYIVNRKYRGL